MIKRLFKISAVSGNGRRDPNFMLPREIFGCIIVPINRQKEQENDKIYFRFFEAGQ